MKVLKVSKDDLSRYDRQMRITGWGRPEQELLDRACILIAGIGGLGSCSAMLLASAGVGHIRIVDGDEVEVSNLNRQLLYWEKDVGSRKAISAGEKLGGMNSKIKVEAIDVEINEDSVGGLLDGVDAIVDGLDNFETRYLLNREAVKRNLAFLHGSVYGLEGRATTILPGRSPCLRCIYESGPKPGIFPVAGPVPALVASIQALEAIKFIAGLGTTLSGRMLVFDGEDLTFSEIEISRNPNCPVCGEVPPSA